MITFDDGFKHGFKLQSREIRAIRHKLLFMNRATADDVYKWLSKKHKLHDYHFKHHYLPQIRNIIEHLAGWKPTGEKVFIDKQWHKIYENPKPRIVTFREKNGYIEFMEHFLGLDGEA